MSTRLDIDPELLDLVRRADPMRGPRVRSNAGLDTDAALRLLAPELDRPPQPQRARCRRPALRIAVAAVAVAAALFVVTNAISTGNSAGVSRAQAQILSHIRDSLLWPPHAIYEEEAVMTVTGRDGATFTSEDHEWLSTSPPYNMRLVRIWNGKVQWEQAFVNHQLDIYDPRINTIYLAPMVAPGSTPIGWCRGTVVAHGCQQVPDEPQWNSALSEVRSLLEQAHGVTINTRAALNGARAIELTFDHGRFSYWISPDTYQPLQVEDRADGLPDGQPGVGIGRYPVARILTGSAAPPSLLSLQAQHPGASIDHSPTDYTAALWRMYRTPESVTPAATGPQPTTTTTTTPAVGRSVPGAQLGSPGQAPLQPRSSSSRS